MNPIRYHRQLGRSLYIWGIFTPKDFGTLIIALGFNLAMLDSTAAMIAILAGYPAYLAALRLGRPPGNDFHFFNSFVLPTQFRPGRAEPARSWIAEP